MSHKCWSDFRYSRSVSGVWHKKWRLKYWTCMRMNTPLGRQRCRKMVIWLAYTWRHSDRHTAMTSRQTVMKLCVQSCTEFTRSQNMDSCIGHHLEYPASGQAKRTRYTERYENVICLYQQIVWNSWSCWWLSFIYIYIHLLSVSDDVYTSAHLRRSL